MLRVGFVAWSLGVMAANLATAEEAPPVLQGREICDIQIQPREVFDLDAPGENHRFLLWANALHVRTRLHVIRRELLFDVGQAFDPKRVAESERNLRGLGIFQDVSVDPETLGTGVRLVVRTSDRWTTEVRTDVSRRGGINALTLGIEESNFLGSAVSVGGSVQTSNDVDAIRVGWHDPRLLHSRWDAFYNLRLDDLEDAQALGLSHPFYSETASWTADIDLHRSRGERRLFDGGLETDRLHLDSDTFEGYWGLHGQGELLSRWGLLASRRHLAGDVEDDIAMLGLLWSVLERQYRHVHDVDLFGVGEDAAAGWTLQFGLGADVRGFGARRNRPFGRLDASWARFVGDRAFYGFQARTHAFVDEGRLEDGRAAVEAYGFCRTVGTQTFAWRAGLTSSLHQPRFVRDHLGGDDRLRGYEARHLSGTRSLYLNLEKRLFTERRLFFLRLGGIVFADVASAWDEGETPDGANTRFGGGLGLRIGNNRAGSGMTGVDVAFGRRSIQVSVSSGSFFRAARGLTFPLPTLFR